VGWIRCKNCQYILKIWGGGGVLKYILGRRLMGDQHPLTTCTNSSESFYSPFSRLRSFLSLFSLCNWRPQLAMIISLLQLVRVPCVPYDLVMLPKPSTNYLPYNGPLLNFFTVTTGMCMHHHDISSDKHAWPHTLCVIISCLITFMSK